MATTLQNLRDIFYGILRENEDASAYPLVLADLFLNASQQKICLWNVVNPLTKEQLKKWQLHFLNTDKFYSSVQSVTLWVDAVVGWTTLDLDTTNYPTTWIVTIAGNNITYTGKSATQLTGCTDILFAHKAWSTVDVLYSLPTDYATTINLTYNNVSKLECKLYDDVFESKNDIKRAVYPNFNNTNYTYWVKPFYTIKDGVNILLWNINENGKQLRLRYEKKATTMVESTDEVVIDNDIYAQTTIPYLAVAEMMYNRGEEARAWELINYAMWQIREMYTYYNQASFEKQSGWQYTIAKGRLNI